MKYFILPTLLLTFLFTSSWNALGADPVWPAPGSVFPTGKDLKRPTVSDDRLGVDVWKKAPAVISPYDASYYDYMPILWGDEKRMKDDQEYYAILKDMYIRAGMVYSGSSTKKLNDARMPFYNTNLTNLLYTSNKGGKDAKKQYLKSRNRNHFVRKAKGKSATLEDPAVDKFERTNAKKIAKIAKGQRSLGFDLRDEASYTYGACSPIDFDFSPISIKHFRKWLKSKYKKIDALNRQWGTNFSSFDVAMPMTTDEIQAREFAKQKKGKGYTTLGKINLSPWADHREYNDDTFHAAVARYRDEIHKIDPDASVGYSGTQMPSAYGGFDFWKLCNNISWSEYYEILGSREIIRSFLPRHYPALSAIFLGNDVDIMQNRFGRLWRVGLHGDPSALVWPYHGGDVSKTTFLDVADGKGKLNAIGQKAKENFRLLRNGILCLTRNTEFETDPIGIYYSHASLRADWMMEVKRDKKNWIHRTSSWESSHNYAAASREGYYKLIEDLGFQFNIYAGEQVAQGELQKQGVKLLIMPRIFCLSKAEIKALRTFVEQGGTLVTDLHAGQMDLHCRVVDNKDFDALLGIKRGEFAYEEDLKAEILKGGYKGGYGSKFDLTFQSDFGAYKANQVVKVQGFQEPHVSAGTAKAHAKTNWGPALFENKVGKGRVFTLNFDTPNVLGQRAHKSEDDKKATAFQRALFSELISRAGIKSSVVVSQKVSKQYPVGMELFRLSKKDAQYVALHSNAATLIDWATLIDKGAGVAGQDGKTISFKVPKKAYVTEMMSGKSFGFVDAFEMPVQKNRPLVFSLLPYQVKSLSAKVGSKIADKKISVDLKIMANKTPADHVVHAELYDKSGKPIPESLVNLPLINGAYSGAIDLSHVPNLDARGPYVLKLNDVASGKKAEAKLSI